MLRSPQVRLLLAFFILSAGIAFAIGAQTPSSFEPDTYWPPLLAPQGVPPERWSEIEKSLAPSACGQCHADQFVQWQTSRHAHAMSPGVIGQLLSFAPGETAECTQCHASLAEQHTAFETARAGGVANREDRLGLAAAGNSCGGCHLRGYHRFGPPQRGTGAVGQSATPSVHDGVMRTKFFESSEFCGRCHQFANDAGVNGKPLENTYVEWRASPQAAQGQTCQNCHMPDRRHLWRGIHDPDMVRSGLTMKSAVDGQRARFEITNSGVGHAFPTYAVPRVIMHAVALDSAGVPRRNTEVTHVIAREVQYANNDWTEISDTRLMPLQTAAIELRWNGADRIRLWLEVIPDHYYATQVYPALLQNAPLDSPATALIAKAAAGAAASPYRLFETELRRP